ncbi:MAG TPA: hypothetical protein VGY55_03905 [Pirellulales bacterium]|jgi:hypothetical protein|nr:hypothetical protein [Pirellulales bacterium]
MTALSDPTGQRFPPQVSHVGRTSALFNSAAIPLKFWAALDGAAKRYPAADATRLVFSSFVPDS